MSNSMFETLESRRMLTVAVDTALLTSSDVATILAQAASQAKPSQQTQAIVVVDRFGAVLGEFDEKGLTTATPGMTAGMITEIELDATLRAKTAALFESDQNAFSTRTARFIIQDHFPQPITDTPGGPLYGVQFSTAEGSDVEIPNSALAATLNPAGLSGDPGGIPLYKSVINSAGKRVMEAVGAIGVAGDFKDIAARQDLFTGTGYALAANPRGKVFNGGENSDFDEADALAGALHYMAPPIIRANNIFIDGLRTPFAASGRAGGHRNLTLAQLVASGAGTIVSAPTSATPNPEQAATYAGDPGVLSRQNFRANPTVAAQNYSPVASNDTAAVNLTVNDVNKVITDAVKEALSIRAGIRNPIGVHPDVYVSVVDRDGDLIGSFGMNDATRFSYDVSVQKARTAAFFSDDTHAFSTRAVGFLSQRYLPPGISSDGTGGLFGIQNAMKFADVVGNAIVDDTLRSVGTVTTAANPLGGPITVSAAAGKTFAAGQIVTFGSDTAHEYLITATTATTISLQLDGIDASLISPPNLTAGETILPKNPLKDGITIFPGGVPLYKSGVLVGAVGISGDGVDQDDIISFNAAAGFQPPDGTRSDQLDKSVIPAYIASKAQAIEQTFVLGSAFPPVQNFNSQISVILQRLTDGLRHLRLPYVKFPRNPEI